MMRRYTGDNLAQCLQDLDAQSGSGTPGVGGGGGGSTGLGSIPTRLAELAYNVKAYGAVGDGSTDDTTAINNTILAAADGGIVFFPAGTYMVSSVITVGNPDITLTGADATIRRTADTYLNVNAARLTVENLTFDGNNGTGPTWSNEWLSIHQNDVTVRGCRFIAHGTQASVYIVGAYNAVARVSVTDCYFGDQGTVNGGGVSVVGSTYGVNDVLVQGCTFVGVKGIKARAYDVACYRWRFVDNTFTVSFGDTSNGTAFEVTSNSTFDPEDVVISGNTIEITANAFAGISLSRVQFGAITDNVVRITAGTTTYGFEIIGEDLSVANNGFDLGGFSINAIYCNTMTNSVVTGNRITGVAAGTGGSGITLTNIASGICSRNIVANNYIEVTTTTTSGAGVHVRCHNNTPAATDDNVVVNNTVIGAGSGTSAAIGVKIDGEGNTGTVDGTVVQGNTLSGLAAAYLMVAPNTATHMGRDKIDDCAAIFSGGTFGSAGVQTINSNTTVTLYNYGDVFTISGTTTITSVTASWPHRRVTLIFSGALTFTDGSNLKLNGNFVTTADDTITLVCDGTNWFEVARSAN